MRKIIDENSVRQGLKVSRLPRFTPEEVKYIRGTFDFMGFNYYTGGVPNTSKLNQTKVPSFENDLGFSMYQKAEWERPLITWQRVNYFIKILDFSCVIVEIVIHKYILLCQRSILKGFEKL